MADIIDIIHRLSYEVNPGGIEDAIKKLQTQADVIEKLRKSNENLAIAQKSSLNPNEYDKLTASIATNKKEIDARTAAITKSFNENKKLQAALQDEVGILQHLTELSKRLKEERTKATDPKDIATITQSLSQVNSEIKRLTTASKTGQEIISKQEMRTEIGYLEQLQFRLKLLQNTIKTVSFGDTARITQAIIQTQNEIKRVQTPSSTGSDVISAGGAGQSIISQILGLGNTGSIGRQLLVGSLAGLGIGSGIGIITRVTDALVKYGEELFDAEGKAEKLAEANEKLITTFSKFGDEIEKEIADLKLLNITANGLSDTVDAYQRQANAVKALGIVNRDVFTAEKNQLEANNLVRQRQLEDLQTQKNALQVIADVVSKSNTQVSAYFNSPQVKAFGDPTQNKNAQFDVYNTLLRNVSSAAIPADIKAKITTELNKGYKDGADLLAVLNKETVTYGVNLVKVNQDIENNKAATDAANQEFQTKIREEADNLATTLLRANKKAEEQYNIERLKGYDETAKRIVQIIELQRQQELKEVNDEIEDARLKGTLRADVLEQYQRKEVEINKRYNLQKIEQVKAFVQKYTEIGDKIEKAVISAAPGTLGALIDPSNPDQAKNSELADARNKKILSDFEAFSEQLHQRAIKNNETLKEIDKELGDAKLLVTQQTNANIVKAYEDTYNQLAALAKQNALTQTLNTSLFHDTNIADIAQGVLTGSISKQRGSFLTGQQQGFKDIDSLTRQRNATQSALQAATAYQANLKNNPDLANKTTPEELQKAQNEITSLQDQLQVLDAKIFNTETGLKDKRKQFIVEQIDQYASLAEAGVEAYQKIAAAHQQYLETEIQIQTEKVREAEFIANRGNTAALQEQQKVLDKQNQQKELAAKREIEINDALVVSNTLLTIAKAAVEGGAGAAFTIAAAVIALVAGFAAASVTAQNANTQVQFWKGGYTGDGAKFDDAGTVHKGEFVFNKETTARYRPIFEAIHKGYDPLQVLAQKEYYSSTNTKQDNTALLEKIDGLELAVRQSKTEVHAVQDIHGMAIFTKQAQAREARRFK